MYFIASLLGLVGWLWLVVNAFRKSGAVQGILCIVTCGLYAIYYGIKHFAENKVPLILYLVGIALSLAFRPDLSALQAAAGH